MPVRSQTSAVITRAWTYFSELMSITKRYFTSCLNMRSKASLIFWIGITSTSATMLFLAAVVEHLLCLRHAADHRPGNGCALGDQREMLIEGGFSGRPTSVIVPSCLSSADRDQARAEPKRCRE